MKKRIPVMTEVLRRVTSEVKQALKKKLLTLSILAILLTDFANRWRVTATLDPVDAQ